MTILLRSTIFGLPLLLVAPVAYGHFTYGSSEPWPIPNGAVISCSACHSTPPSLNPFGSDFKANNQVWNAALATKDSDGDGATNGQELGDPAGSWVVGNADPPGPVFNPGDAASHPAATPPVITTQPVSQSVPAGTNVTFTVVATGSEPLTYQWQKDGSNLSDGGRISGATTSTLTLTDVTEADAGSYVVIVSSGTESTTSTPAVLTVTSAEQPALAIIRNGDHVQLSWPASAAGYQLQETSDLSAPVWSDVTETPQPESGRFVLNLPATTDRRFYRLTKKSALGFSAVSPRFARPRRE